MADDQKNRETMRAIWKSMHESDPAMPPDQLIFEGENDLAYLYSSGFVDTDQFSYQEWAKAFRSQRQKDGRFVLSLDEWLDKTKFRYAGPIYPPFDLDRIQDGDWTEEDFRKLIVKYLLPETAITEKQFFDALKAGEQTGEIKDGIVKVDAALKEELKQLLDRFPSVRRSRGLGVGQALAELQSAGDLPETGASTQGTQSTEPSKAEEKSSFAGNQDRRKDTMGQLSKLLSGGKK